MMQHVVEPNARVQRRDERARTVRWNPLLGISVSRNVRAMTLIHPVRTIAIRRERP